MELNDESLAARVQQLERERDDLHKDIEQLCMQQAGPAYLGVATRLHFQRTAALEQDVENLKKKLATCMRENQNFQEELSEAYRIKSHLADLLSAEVSKNAEAEKQVKFFQGCVATAFAERDNAIMEAEKAKEKVELMPQELNKTQKKVEELTCELLEEKELAKTLQADVEKQKEQNDAFKEVIDRFYDIRQCSVGSTTDANWEEKCECLLNDTADMWRFQDEDDTSTSNYISSLEAEVGTLRKSVDHLQNKLRVGMEIESHLKKKVSKLEKKKIISEEKLKKQRSDLLHCHSQCKIDILKLLDEGYLELKSIMCLVDDTIKQLELCKGEKLESPSIQETELQESECRDVHVNVDSAPYPSSDPGLPTSNTTETGDSSDAFAQALQEKVSTLLLLSQEEERHLLERDVNAALQKKIEELQRNLLQVTNEKVRALMELAQLKQERYIMQEKMNEGETQGKQLGKNQEQRIIPQEKDGKFKHFLKKSYLTRWAGGSDDSGTYQNYENPNKKMDFARMKIENVTLKESLGSMEHLLSSIRRLRTSLSKLKELSMTESTKCGCLEDLDQIIAETNLLKTALSSSLPVSWSADSEGSYGEVNDKTDFVSGAGREMVELLLFASLLLKDRISLNQGGPELATDRPSADDSSNANHA